MGCAASTQQVALPQQQDTTGSAQAGEGSKENSSRSLKKANSYKKNQVVPVDSVLEPTPPSQAQRAAARGQEVTEVKPFEPPSSVAASTFSVQPAAASKPPLPPSSVADTFLTEVVQACRAKPLQISTLSRQLRDLARKTPTYFNKQGSPPRQHDLQNTAEAIVACLDALLQPLLTAVERQLSHQQASSSSSRGDSTWDTIDLSYYKGALESAAQASYSQALSHVGAQVGMLLDIQQGLHSLWLKHYSSGTGSNTSFQVPSLVQVVSSLGIIFFRKVTLESQEALQAKQEQVTLLLSELGWQPQALAVALDPQSRSTLLYLELAAGVGECKASFEVRRSRAFWDALEEAQQHGLLPAVGSAKANGAGVCFKVFPAFVDEQAAGGRRRIEAGEGHGPRKEFFACAGADMTGGTSSSSSTAGAAYQPAAGSAQQPPLFTYNRTAGAFWFNPELQEKKSGQLVAAYQFAGWLAAQCLLNRAPLCVPLAPVLFSLLLQGPAFQPDLTVLEQFDPAAASTVRNVAGLKPDQLREMLDLEGLPPGLTAQQYIAHASRQILVESVEWQSQAMASGFGQCLDPKLLAKWCMGPTSLADVVAGRGGGGQQGRTGLDIQKVFRVVMDDELSALGTPMGDLLWQVLSAWPPDRQQQFLAFVTGTDRLPAPGSELLKIEAPFVAMGMAEHREMLGKLPQAHTCDNLLELPNYWDSLMQVRGVRDPKALSPSALAELRAECSRILDDRLTLAVTSCSGYGLDERDGNDAGDDDADWPGQQTTGAGAVSASKSGVFDGSVGTKSGSLPPLKGVVLQPLPPSKPLPSIDPVAPQLSLPRQPEQDTENTAGHSNDVLAFDLDGSGSGVDRFEDTVQSFHHDMSARSSFVLPAPMGLRSDASTPALGGGTPVMGKPQGLALHTHQQQQQPPFPLGPLGPEASVFSGSDMSFTMLGALAPPMALQQADSPAVPQGPGRGRELLIDLAEGKDATILKLSQQSLDPFSPLGDLSGFRGVSEAARATAAAGATAAEAPAGGGAGGEQGGRSGRHLPPITSMALEDSFMQLEVPKLEGGGGNGQGLQQQASMSDARVVVLGDQTSRSQRADRYDSPASVNTADLDALLDQITPVSP